MKRFIALLLALAAAAALIVTADAGSDPSDWQGTPLSMVQDMHGISYLVLTKPGTAFLDHTLAENDKFFYVVVTAGNYQGRGESRAKLEFLDGGGNVVKSFGTAMIPDDGSFHRAEIGDSSGDPRLYAPVPEGTVTMRLSISYEQGVHSPYFIIGQEITETAPADYSTETWKVSGRLSDVSVETTAFSYWVTVAFVFLVALGMFGIKKMRDSANKNKINKKQEKKLWK